MPDRLELELAEALRPAAAPPELWERIERPRPAPMPRLVLTPAWPVAAGIVLMIATGASWLIANMRRPNVPAQHLAIEAFHDAGALEMHSSDPAEISRWLREQTGTDVRLPARSGVRLLGARVIRKGNAPIAAVAYRVAGSDVDATFLIAHANTPVDAGCRLCHANL